MKLTTNHKILVSYSVALVLILVMAVASRVSMTRLIETARSVEHTHKALIEIEAVFSLLKDAQRGERGYIITGEEAYLAPFNASVRDLPIRLRELKKITIDNRHQQARLEELSQLVSQVITALQERIIERRERGIAAVIAAVKTGEAKKAMDECAQLITAMKAEEQSLLRYRAAENEKSVKSTEHLMGAAMVTFLVFGAVSLLMVRQDFKRRKKEEEELAGPTPPRPQPTRRRVNSWPT